MKETNPPNNQTHTSKLTGMVGEHLHSCLLDSKNQFNESVQTSTLVILSSAHVTTPHILQGRMVIDCFICLTNYTSVCYDSLVRNINSL